MAAEPTAAEMFATMNINRNYEEDRSVSESAHESDTSSPEPRKPFWTKLIKVEDDKNDPEADALVSLIGYQLPKRTVQFL